MVAGALNKLLTNHTQYGSILQKVPVGLFVACLAISLVSCGGKGGTHMTPDQLLASIQQGSAPVIVDVRTQSEYDSGHVPGATHLPFHALWSRHAELKGQPEDPVVLYCEHGPRAWIGKLTLWTLGYTNLVYLDGHMSGWKQRGLPMEKPSSADKT